MIKGGARKSQLLIGVIALILVLTSIAAIIYFTRTPDSEFENAKKQVDSLQQAAETIDQELAATDQVAAIDQTTLDNLRNANKNLQSSSDFSSSIVTKNQSINEVYSQRQSNINTYRSQVDELTTVIAAYLDIAEQCQAFTSTVTATATASSLSSSAAPCTTAIDNVAGLPSNNFKNDFLTAYATEARNYIATLISQPAAVSASEKQRLASNAAKSYNQIIEMGNKKIDYDITPIPASTYKTLRDSISTEKSKLIRS